MKKEIFPLITVQPDVRFGKPVIEGTRIPVDLIVGKLASGMPLDEVMREYDLQPEQVRAALGYAAELVAEETLAFV